MSGFTSRGLRNLSLCLLALIASVLLGIGHAQRSVSHEPGKPAVTLPMPRTSFYTPAPAYTFEDRPVHEAPETPSAASAATPGKVDALNIAAAYERANNLAAQTKDRVFKTSIRPHWLPGQRFWYRNDLPDKVKEFILVDAFAGTRQPAFDHQKLAAALSQATGVTYDASRLPFDSIDFVDDDKALRVRVDGVSWQCDLTTYQCERTTQQPQSDELEESLEPAAEDDEALAPQPENAPRRPQVAKQPRPEERRWFAFVKEHNVYLRDKDGGETRVTETGVAGNGFGSLTWSPDSKTLVAYRTTPADNKEVYTIESSPRNQLAAKLHTRVYPRPGDKFATYEMWLIDVESKKAVRADVERIDFRGPPRLRWNNDCRHFTFEKTDRDHQRFRVIEVDVAAGTTRDIIDEQAATFIDHYSFHHIQYLDDTGEILYVSEMDGWKHLYLIDARAGKIKNQITQGEYVVRGIERVDVKNRQIWFRASGKNAEQDPYLIHFYRVNFDGSGLTALTAGNGNHSVQFAPNNDFLIDTYSRVDMPAVHELRRASDGALVCELEKADIAPLLAAGWRAPEVFVAKGRDGVTDIWGIVCRPQQYDTANKYPVIEYIYAGPHDSFVPKSFPNFLSKGDGRVREMQALAELGFIVVQIDGMGTANRSRAFHDICWQNIADAGFPDRILWMKALADRYAYVDISRVGIYGTSAGGQSALGGLLFHPEFYKVAVAACGCHDNRLDKASWNEQWLGLPGPHYEAQSNVTNAGKLQGRLLLIVGELDTNVPPESTLRVVDALIRADKDFDLLFMPGVGHSSGGNYGERRRWDFFVRHLHGVEAPERNRLPRD